MIKFYLVNTEYERIFFYIKDISLLYKIVKFFVKFLSKYQLHNWSQLLLLLNISGPNMLK